MAAGAGLGFAGGSERPPPPGQAEPGGSDGATTTTTGTAGPWVPKLPEISSTGRQPLRTSFATPAEGYWDKATSALSLSAAESSVPPTVTLVTPHPKPMDTVWRLESVLVPSRSSNGLPFSASIA